MKGDNKMKYKATMQLVIKCWDGVQGVSDSDILMESDNLEEVIKELGWRYLEEDLIDVKDMLIGTQYICFLIEAFDDDELINMEEIYAKI